MAVAAVSNTIAHKNANKRYDDEAEQTEGWSPAELFTEVTSCIESGGRPSQGPAVTVTERTGALFMPADEITELKWLNRKTLQVKWRNVVYKFTQTPKLEADMLEGWDQAYRELKDWQEQAEQVLAERAGGPAEPGLASIVEWAGRPAGPAPSWVPGAVHQFLADTDPAAIPKLLKRVPMDQLGRLSGKLRQLPSAEAEEFAHRVEQIPAQKSQVPIWAGLVGLVLDLVLWVAVAVVAVAEILEGDLVAVGFIAALVLGVIALICLLVGWDIRNSFRKGARAVTTE